MSGLLDIIGNPTAGSSAAPTPIYKIKLHRNNVSAVVFFKHSRRIVTASWDCTLRIWDVDRRALVGEPFRGHRDFALSVAVSADDRQIASDGHDRAIIISDVDSRQMVFKPLVKDIRWVQSVCFSPDGQRLASGSDDETVIIWDVEIGDVLLTLRVR